MYMKKHLKMLQVLLVLWNMKIIVSVSAQKEKGGGSTTVDLTGSGIFRVE